MTCYENSVDAHFKDKRGWTKKILVDKERDKPPLNYRLDDKWFYCSNYDEWNVSDPSNCTARYLEGSNRIRVKLITACKCEREMLMPQNFSNEIIVPLWEPMTMLKEPLDLSLPPLKTRRFLYEGKNGLGQYIYKEVV